MSIEYFESGRSLEVELEEIKELQEKREGLEKCRMKLSDQRLNIEMKYAKIKRKTTRPFNDRSDYSSTDLEKLEAINREEDEIEDRRDEIDKEIINRRFDVGLKNLTELNGKEDPMWHKTQSSEPRVVGPLVFQTEKWSYTTDDMDAQLNVSREQTNVFGDEKKALPPERGLKLDFSVGPKSKSRFDRITGKSLYPGLGLQKAMGESSYHVCLPGGQQAYAYPKIDEEKNKQAEEEMLKLAQKLGIEY